MKVNPTERLTEGKNQIRGDLAAEHEDTKRSSTG